MQLRKLSTPFPDFVPLFGDSNEAESVQALSGSTSFDSGSGSFTVPSGNDTLTIEAWGGGGGGGSCTFDDGNGGGGGGGGGYCIKSGITVVGGTTSVTYSVGDGGEGGGDGDPNGGDGGTTTASISALSISMSAEGGGGNRSAFNPITAAGGTASGGDTNTTGGDGPTATGRYTTVVGGTGGSSPNGGAGGAGGINAGAVAPTAGGVPGGGGGGNGLTAGRAGANGAGGKVTFTYSSGGGDVSMPTSYPCLTRTVNLHDRMWPMYWVPGINHFIDQSQNLKFALPMWEQSGNSLQDLVGGYVGQGHKFVNSTRLEMWGGDASDIFGYAWVNPFYADFGDMSFDLTQGFTVSTWAKSTSHEAPEQTIFACGDFKFYYKFFNLGGYEYGDHGEFIIEWANDLDGTSTSQASWEIETAIAPDYIECWRHYAVVCAPDDEGYDALTATRTNAGYYQPGTSTFLDTYFVILHGGASGGTKSNGIVRFTLNLDQGVTVGTTVLHLPSGGSGAYPLTFNIACRQEADPIWPDYLSAPSQADGLGLSVTVTASSAADLDVDVTTLVQQIVDQVDWVSGNHITFYLIPTVLTSPVSQHYISANSNGPGAISLSIEGVPNGCKVDLFIDGEPFGGTWHIEETRPTIQSGQFLLGSADTYQDPGSGATNGNSLNGYLKDFRIYDAPLSHGLIDRIYRFPEDLYAAPLPVLTPFSLSAVVVNGEGGVVCGGSAKVGITIPVSGGFVVGGEANITDGGNGGVVMGGTATPSGGTTETPTGGVVCGGTSIVTTAYAYIPSGGVVISEYPFRYARKITVPAGKVSEDLDSFYLGIVVQLDPVKVGEPKFQITNFALHNLPFEIREYDEDTGKLTAYVRTPIRTATNTTLYLFYGDS